MALYHPPRRNVRVRTSTAATGLIILSMGIFLSFVTPYLIFNRLAMEQLLIAHGATTSFHLDSSTQARGGPNVRYSFDAPDVSTGKIKRFSGRQGVSNERAARFANPAYRLVIYDPDDPEKSAIANTWSDFSELVGERSRQAPWIAGLVALLGFAGLGAVLFPLAKEWRLCRCGVEADSVSMALVPRAWPKSARIEYRFTDRCGMSREGKYVFNEKSGGPSTDQEFASYKDGAAVLYDPKSPDRSMLFMPKRARFRILHDV